MIDIIRQDEAAARAAVPLLRDGGLQASWVSGDIVRVIDGRGVIVDLHVRRVEGVVEAAWRVLDEIEPPADPNHSTTSKGSTP